MTKEDDFTQEDVVDTLSAEDRLGLDTIAEIAEKEWKIAELPDEEELKKQKPKNPKARNNINSRKNLVQYKKDKPKETKEKITKGLKYKKKRAQVDPFDYISINDSYKDTVKSFLPDRRVMKDADEEVLFYRSFNAFLKDFQLDELSASDFEDISSLALNKILESRLLSVSASDPNALIDATTSIEKYRKHSDKIKNNLANRRSDRIDPSKKQNFSIVDIVQAFDDDMRDKFNERIKGYEKEKEEFVRKKKKGNI